MRKNDASDCPLLENVPASADHESRFLPPNGKENPAMNDAADKKEGGK